MKTTLSTFLLTLAVSTFFLGIAFASNHTIRSPRDTASGQLSGKHTIKSPRDPASGQATGKKAK